MVVAMIAMRVMEAAVDEIIDMVAMRYRFVPASRPVDVTRVVAAAALRALIRIPCADFERVFVDMVAVRMVQMAIVQVIDVVAMPDCGMTAARTVLMLMLGMMRFVARAHAYLLDLPGGTDVADPLEIV
ncbi:hypothetical protein WJ60_26180 [Burkholderia ubonensis]|nr:hypothetical protein WJ60_26180 [Burkholderia ubonensis]